MRPTIRVCHTYASRPRQRKIMSAHARRMVSEPHERFLAAARVVVFLDRALKKPRSSLRTQIQLPKTPMTAMQLHTTRAASGSVLLRSAATTAKAMGGPTPTRASVKAMVKSGDSHACAAVQRGQPRSAANLVTIHVFCSGLVISPLLMSHMTDMEPRPSRLLQIWRASGSERARPGAKLERFRLQARAAHHVRQRLRVVQQEQRVQAIGNDVQAIQHKVALRSRSTQRPGVRNTRSCGAHAPPAARWNHAPC